MSCFSFYFLFITARVAIHSHSMMINTTTKKEIIFLLKVSERQMALIIVLAFVGVVYKADGRQNIMFWLFMDGF